MFTGLLLALLGVSGANAQFYGKDVHEVANADELLRALGSDRTVRITTPRIELGAAATGLEIRGHRNLRIIGARSTGTEIVSAGDGALTIADGFNIDLRQLTIRLESTATNGVLAVVGVTNLLVRDCTLSGAAATGLTLRKAARVMLFKTTVLNCGSGILRADETRNVLFEASRLIRNEGDRGFELRHLYDLQLERCEFNENTFKTGLFGLVASSGVQVIGCQMNDNRFPRTSGDDKNIRFIKQAGR